MSIRSNSMKNQKAVRSCTGLSAAFFMLGALLANPAQSDNSVGPWVDQPATGPAMNSRAAHRPCAANDLQIVLGQKGAYRGHATQEIRLTNRGADTCSLPGFPSMQLLPAGEAPQTLAAHELAPQLATDRVDLDPGEDVVILVGTPGSCDASIGPQRKVSTRLQLALPGGGLKVLDGAHVDTLCGRASIMHFEAVQSDAAASARAAAGGSHN